MVLHELARDVARAARPLIAALAVDQKFDAYRVLGRHAARAALEAMKQSDGSDRNRRSWLARISLFQRLQQRL